MNQTSLYERIIMNDKILINIIFSLFALCFIFLIIYDEDFLSVTLGFIVIITPTIFLVSIFMMFIDKNFDGRGFGIVGYYLIKGVKKLNSLISRKWAIYMR